MTNQLDICPIPEPITGALSLYESDGFSMLLLDIPGILGPSELWLDMWDPNPLPRITKMFGPLTKDSRFPAGTLIAIVPYCLCSRPNWTMDRHVGPQPPAKNYQGG